MTDTPRTDEALRAVVFAGGELGPEHQPIVELCRALECDAITTQAVIAKINAAPRVVSAEADFEALTWTFKISPVCDVGGGTYALVWVSGKP